MARGGDICYCLTGVHSKEVPVKHCRHLVSCWMIVLKVESSQETSRDTLRYNEAFPGLVKWSFWSQDKKAIIADCGFVEVAFDIWHVGYFL